MRINYPEMIDTYRDVLDMEEQHLFDDRDEMFDRLQETYFDTYGVKIRENMEADLRNVERTRKLKKIKNNLK